MALKVPGIESFLIGIGGVVSDVVFYGVKQKTVCDYFWIVEVIGTAHTGIVQTHTNNCT